MAVEVILVPTFNRPEFLWLNLEFIQRCPDLGDREIWVCLDRGTASPARADVWAICKRHRVNLIERAPHRYRGNSFNVLTAYREALDAGAERIFLVEEDVLVCPDFFRWHDTVHGDADLFCSVAARNTHLNIRTVTDSGAYFTSRTDYASLGVCWNRGRLQYVVKHARPEYFQDLMGYVIRTFPRSRFGAQWSEQDGLIRRVQEELNGLVAFPYVPRAFHMGWYGYNRPGNTWRPMGSLEERVNILRPIMTDAGRLAELEKTFHDVEAYRLPGDWSTVYQREACR